MNKIERAKIDALRDCRMGFGSWDAEFVNSLAAQMHVDATLTLSARQKFMLDTVVFRYRRQLAGQCTFELPADPPNEADYVRGPPAQASLFT